MRYAKRLLNVYKKRSPAGSNSMNIQSSKQESRWATNENASKKGKELSKKRKQSSKKQPQGSRKERKLAKSLRGR